MYSTWIVPTNQPIVEKSVGTRGSIYMMCTDNYSEVFGDSMELLFATPTLYTTISYLQYPTISYSYNIQL